MDRWNYTDKKLKEMYKKYLKINLRTQDKIQEVFNNMDFTYSTLYNYVLINELKKINRIIEEMHDNNSMDETAKYLSKKIYKKQRVTYYQILQFLIYKCYLEERNIIKQYELDMFDDIANTEYIKAQEEVFDSENQTKETKTISNTYVTEMLKKPNSKGYIWDEYILAILFYNTNQICRQYIIDLQQNLKTDVNNSMYQNLFHKQRNTYLCINEDKISGDLELETIGLVNNAIKDGYLIANPNAKVRFVAEIDKRTTEMCDSLDNQIFKLNEWNTYQRYSEIDGKIVTYKTFGLELGSNLPPINNHFHWCRSTITYQTDMSREELNKVLLTTNEQDAINRWLSSDFYDINRKMYSDIKLNRKEKRLVKNLYTALNKQPYYITKENEYIKRVLDLSKEDIDVVLKEHQIGKIYKSKSYESYSLRNDYNKDANVIFYVRNSKKARNMLKYNPMEEEAEVLYQYGTKFVTRDYFEKDGKYYFLLEEL